jgi:hypothetical protein
VFVVKLSSATIIEACADPEIVGHQFARIGE